MGRGLADEGGVAAVRHSKDKSAVRNANHGSTGSPKKCLLILQLSQTGRRPAPSFLRHGKTDIRHHRCDRRSVPIVTDLSACFDCDSNSTVAAQSFPLRYDTATITKQFQFFMFRSTPMENLDGF